MQPERGKARLTLLEWVILIIILSVLTYSAIRVKGSEIREFKKFIDSETRALERVNPVSQS